MPNRVTPDDVVPYLKVPQGVSLEPFIDDAHTIVDIKVGPSTSSGLTEDVLKLVEKNLTCHLFLLGVESGGVVQEQTGESSAKYGNVSALGAGLRSTRFGQMVLSLDTSGIFTQMADAGLKKSAQFRVA